uniref:Uncharacterized protein n=1 Tax=Oryza brachyantha TaxID=4533 RepID=J3M0M0_ORYBR
MGVRGVWSESTSIDLRGGDMLLVFARLILPPGHVFNHIADLDLLSSLVYYSSY